MRHAFNIPDAGLRRWLFLFGVLAVPGALANVACDVACARNEACEVRSSRGTLTLDARQYVRHDNCGSLQVSKGAVQIRYRHKGRPVAPILLATERADHVFVRFPPDECAVASFVCVQERMNGKNVTAAGQGIDGARSSPAGSGSPCSLGLPCGVVLPPPTDWKFRLTDRAFQGRLELQVLRGSGRAASPRQLLFPVASGEIRGDGGQLAASVVYGYRLVRDDGSMVASGEFAVLSASGLSTLQRLADEQAARNGLSREAAWLDALGANELDWDLNQIFQER